MTLTIYLKMLLKNWMKPRKGFYGQIKNVKLNMVHCVMITKNGGSKNVDI